MLVRKVFTLLGHFPKHLKKYLQDMFIYTENTQNPINALKIIIYNTKHTSNSNIHFKYAICFKYPKLNRKRTNNKNNTLLYIHKLHDSYFVYFVYFLLVYTLTLLYFPRSTSSARGPPSTTSTNDNKRDFATW